MSLKSALTRSAIILLIGAGAASTMDQFDSLSTFDAIAVVPMNAMEPSHILSTDKPPGNIVVDLENGAVLFPKNENPNSTRLS